MIARYWIATEWSPDRTYGVVGSVGHIEVDGVMHEMARHTGPTAHQKVLGLFNEALRMRGEDASKWLQTG